MSNDANSAKESRLVAVVADASVFERLAPAFATAPKLRALNYTSLAEALNDAEARQVDTLISDVTHLQAVGAPYDWRRATHFLPLVLLTDGAASAAIQAALKVVDDHIALDDASAENISRAVNNAANMHQLHSQFRQVLAENPDGVVVVSTSGKVLYANTAAGLLLGRKAQDMQGEHFGVPVTVDETTEVDLENGRVAEMRVVDIEWFGESALLANLRDISERKQAEARLIQAAEHDSLTALPNRAHFQGELSKAIAWAAEHQKMVAVFFIDLDKFKSINDTLGHDAGDQLLRLVADRLLAASRDDTILGRLGGDEFVALARGVGAGDELFIAERFLRELQAPFAVNGEELSVGASIGVSTYPYCGKNAHALIMAADAAMYTAKQGGRNRIKLFSKEAGSATARRKQMEMALRQALSRNEMALVYQPIYCVNGGTPQCTTCEALLRWHQPELGTVPPDEFIPLAESSGWIEAIGHWVVVEVCKQISAWNQHPNSASLPRCVSINLSTRQLKDVRFPEFMSRVMNETGVSPDQIWLEITETGLMHNIDECIEVLTDLRALGLKIAVDDFGTGYSSLAYLQRLPIDVIKIDRAFITGIGSDKGDDTIVKSVMQIAESLDLLVVAEGVETQTECDCLTALNCEYIQGYLLAKPMPASDLKAQLRLQ